MERTCGEVKNFPAHRATWSVSTAQRRQSKPRKPVRAILQNRMPASRRRRSAWPKPPGWPRSIVEFNPRMPWSWFAAATWPAPLRAVTVPTPAPESGLHGRRHRRRHRCRSPAQGKTIVQIQNPRMRLRHFDLVVANRHDAIAGPNVIITRTALHRATPERLAAAASEWAPVFANFPRPLVAVLVGGSNGRFRLGAPKGRPGRPTAAMMKRTASAWHSPPPAGPHPPSRCTPTTRSNRSAPGCMTCRRKPLFRHARFGRRHRGDHRQHLHGLRSGATRRPCW